MHKVKGCFVHDEIRISERLREERDRLGLSQERAASAAGIRREMWAKYEGGAMPGALVLALMASAGVDVIYVLTGVRAITHAGDAALADELREIADQYIRLPADDRAAIRRTLDALFTIAVASDRAAGVRRRYSPAQVSPTSAIHEITPEFPRPTKAKPGKPA